MLKKYIPILVLVGLLIAIFLNLSNLDTLSQIVLVVVLVVGSIPLIIETFQSLARGHFGVDIIALSAIVASFLLGEYLAGSVIVLMLSGGEALEDYALKRARADLRNLLSKAPQKATRKIDDHVEEISVNDVNVGDILIVKPGGIIPVDCVIIEGSAMIDESTLTGESVPTEKNERDQLLSGSINTSSLITVKALKTAKDSKYQSIVELVKNAEKDKAPFVRLADRYSVFFTAVTFLICLLTYLITKDPIRVLSVLVVATPCPLILATPIAFAAGISKAARRGIIVKNGGVLEKLEKCKAFFFDKTGTLTLGTPVVTSIETLQFTKEIVLTLAASLDQFSNHILAQSIVSYARDSGLKLEIAKDFEEKLGFGVSGSFEDKKYFLGKLKYLDENNIVIPNEITTLDQKSKNKGEILVYLADQKKIFGIIHLKDSPRSNVKNVISQLKSRGMIKTLMLTGDKTAVADSISKELGIEDYKAECLPEEKLQILDKYKKMGITVTMIGDGVNDAPAIASADVGVALGFRGTSASTDVADIVIMEDDLGRVLESYDLSKKVLKIAKQGIYFGIGASIILMFLASGGLIPPVNGALIQELIDVLVIFNALRVLI